MTVDTLRSVAQELVEQLVREEYEALIRRCVVTPLTSEDLRSAILDYGRKLVSPPTDAYANLDVVRVKSAVVPTWSMRVPLWTIDEGRSDLTLELTIAIERGIPRVTLDGLHVL